MRTGIIIIYISIERFKGSRVTQHNAARSVPATPLPRKGTRDCGCTHVRRRIASENLLGGGRELEIEHGGEVYRLRETRNGKLILTK